MTIRIPDNGSRGRARLGLVVPVHNTNFESDMILLRPQGVSLHVMRVGGYDLDKMPDPELMREFALSSLEEVISALSATHPDVILYGCTSATLAHGPKFDYEFAQRITKMSGTPVITAAGALVEALVALKAKRIAFSSPYVEALNQEAITFLERCDIQTVSSAYVGSDLGIYGQGELTPEEVYDLGCRADHPEAEVIVLSCTDMRAVEAVDALERDCNKPVVTSNQALLFAALRKLSLAPEVLVRCGRLFDCLL